MRVPFHTTLICLFIGAGMAFTSLSAVVSVMQGPAVTSMRTIELPTVVVIARKASEPATTAQSRATVAKNG